MIVSLDTCGCTLTIGSDGEPSGFVGKPCERHTEASVPDVVAECRAKNIAMARAKSVLAEDQHDALIWGHDDNGHAHAGTVDFMSGVIDVAASCPPVNLQDYVAAVEAL